jgi:hypothetical protein
MQDSHMALRDKLAARAQPYLMPGEQVRQVFMGQSGASPALLFLSGLFAFLFKYRVFVVTDRAIIVLKSGPWTPAKPKELIGRLPREIWLGTSGAIWHSTQLGPELTYIHRRFFKDLQAADAELAMRSGMQPGAIPAGPPA